MTREITRAIRTGSTRPTMALLAIASIFQALQLLMLDPVLSRPRRIALAHIADPDLWAYAHLLAALVICWRLWDRTTRSGWAWTGNGLMLTVWTATYLAPALMIGDSATLGSPIAVLPLAALWVFLRTQATPRDRVQA